MRRDKNYIGLSVILGVIAIGMLSLSGVLMVKGNEKADTLKSIEQEVNKLDATHTTLSEEVTALKNENETLMDEVEALDQKIKELKDQGFEVDVKEPEDAKYAYLTFDDGPSENTVKILDFLKANNIKATFFVLEREGYDDLYKRIVDEGHAIAIHSTDHDYSRIYQSVETTIDDFNDLQDFIQEITGVETNLVRFPGGSNNTVSNRYGGQGIMEEIRPAVEDAGYVYFDWNVDSMDAAKGLQDKEVIVNSVLGQSRNQDHAVILMHDAARKTTTVEALPEIVEGLKKEGFLFRPLEEDSVPVRFK